MVSSFVSSINTKEIAKSKPMKKTVSCFQESDIAFA
jgi:hypothetical protein